MTTLKVAQNNDLRFMLLLATLCSLLLLMTRATVGSRAEITPATVAAVLSLSGHAEKAQNEPSVAEFNQLFARRTSGRNQWWQSVKRPELWACEASGAGMWAEVKLVFVFNRAGLRIVGLRVVEQNETTGLGDRITDDGFLEQFDDLAAANGIEMAAARSKSNQFDAISGATVTSRAVATIVNRALRQLRQLQQLHSTASGEVL